MKRIIFLCFLLASLHSNAQYSAFSGCFKVLSDMKAQKGTGWVITTIIGKDSINDRQYGSYYWNDTSTATSDNDNIVVVTGVSTGRWIRMNNGRTYVIRNINGLSIGNTKLMTTAPAMFGRFIVTAVRIIPKTISGLQIISPLINVGFTATSYNDIISSTSILSAITINSNITPALVVNQSTIPNQTDVYCRVATAGTGYTAFLFDIYISGIYETL